MNSSSSTALPGLMVVVIGCLWGVYWVPLRWLQGLLLAGPWLTFLVVLAGSLCLLPFGWKGRQRLAASNKRALVSIALGGASFVLYSNGLLYGQVAVVILLFYLTPIWSTLIARFWMRWPISPWRYLAIFLGLSGIALVLQGGDSGLPLPRTLGDYLGLSSGILWSVASTGINVHSRTKALETNFIFCSGGAVMALVLALVLGRVSPVPGPLSLVPVAGITGTGLLWWALSLTGFMWASRRLEPARVGILLMSEVIVGAVTAGLFAGEPFAGTMIVGAVLVVAAGIIETLSGPEHARVGQAVSA